MSGAVGACFTCQSILFYDDEKVVGTFNGEPDTRFDVLEPEDYQDGVPEGYSLYCLDCAPCECGDHECLAPHRAVEIDKQNNTP